MRSTKTCTLSIFLALFAVSARAEIVIHEIMYHPASELPAEEWIELRNTGAAPVSVAGWQFTSGVNFTFPAGTNIPAGGYLVVAANAASFAAKYPAVTNFVAGWTGQLSNAANRIALQDHLGVQQDEVRYADDGDWATRVRASVPDDGHRGWGWESEADGGGKSLELINAAFDNSTGQNWSASTAVNGTPGAANSIAAANIAPVIREVAHFPLVPRSTDTVTITARVLDELPGGVANVALNYRNDGAASFTSDPMFDDGAHGDGLAGDGIHGAFITPRASGTIVEFYLTATDGSGNARNWPKTALDYNTGTSSYFPAQVCNALYQVDDATYAGAMPIYRMVLRAADRSELAAINNDFGNQSEARFNATFITVDGTGTELRYSCGLKNRGHFSASLDPQSFNLGIPNDWDWKGRTAFHFNSQYTYLQLFGSAFMRHAGLPAPESRQIQLRVNGMDLTVGEPQAYGCYVCNEVQNSQFAEHHFPQDSGGNIYSVRRTDGAPYQEGDFSYLPPAGVNGGDPYRPVYFKQTNESEDNWSDLIALCEAMGKGQFTTLGATPTWAPDYVTAVQAKVDVAQWMRWFAAEALMSNEESNLSRGYGDDFYLYIGVSDPLARLLPHDLDTIFGHGDAAGPTNRSIFRPIAHEDPSYPANTPTPLYPFLRRPEFAAVFFAELDDLLKGPASVANFNALADQLLTGVVDATTIAARKSWYAARHAYVSGLLPQSISVTSAPPVQNGIPRSTTATCDLIGLVNPVRTRSVRVNGVLAGYTPWRVTGATSANVVIGEWSSNGVALNPGINRLLIQAFDATDAEIERSFIDVWYDDASVVTVGANIAANTTWTAAGGPYQLTANVTVNSGVTLTIQPGTTVYLNGGFDLNVAGGGRILAEGTELQPIRFTRFPGGANWSSITINGTAGVAESRIRYAYIDGNGDAALNCEANSNVWLDHVEFGNPAEQYLNLDAGSFLISHCIFPTATAGFEGVHGNGVPVAGGRAIIRDSFFGAMQGYQDVVDFTGGNRPGTILQLFNNVFIGSDDDILDLDGTDVWIEGNIFMHVHRNGSPDSASAVSGGNDGGGGTGSRRTVTAIDTASEQLTCGTHGFSTGQEVAATALVGNSFPAATPALHNGGPYYVRAVSTTVVKLYLTAADANADTNPLNFTGAIGTGVSLSLCRLSAISHLTIVGNLFYDVDQAATGKEGNFYTFLNNTVIAQNNTGSQDAETGVLNFGDDTYHEASGMYAEGNIIHSAAALTRNYPGAGLAQTVVWNNNLFPPGMTWSGAGSGNTSADALLNDAFDIPTPGPRDYERVAAEIRQKLGLQAGSPARGTGPNGTDKGGVRPVGVSIGGAPVGTTNATTATLIVGTRMTGNGIPAGAGAWENGAGWTHYKWRLDGGAWSAETPISTNISLSGLTNGAHTLDVVGKNDAGLYQDDAALGASARISSATWTVNTAYVPPAPAPLVRINEVLAVNTGTIQFGSAFPDIIELHNAGNAPAVLDGWGLTDNPVLPMKYTFPTGTSLDPGAYLVVYASGSGSVPQPKTGFSIKQSGDSLTLTKSAAQGGGVADSITWGVQLPDFSIGRGLDGAWALCEPSFGAANQLAGQGDVNGVLINEWLADARTLFANDFVELYNPSVLPVDIGGHFLTDNPAEWPDRSPIRQFTFIGPGNYLSFKADGDTSQGPDHVDFKLSPLQGEIGFMSPALAPIDTILYGPQRTDISEGRTPNGAAAIAAFTQPTPGAPNPGTVGGTSTVTTNLIAGDHTWRYFQNASTGPANDSAGRACFHPLYNDTQAGLGWLPASGTAGQALYIESSNFPAAAAAEGFAKTTLLSGFSATRPWQTYYFRTHFNYSGPLTGVTLSARVMCDDAAAIYLNGALVQRIRLTADPVLHSSTGTSGADNSVETVTIPADQLLVGDNVLAVSVHQDSTQSAGAGSSDIVWTIKLDASVPVGAGANPVVVNEVLPVNATQQNPDGSFAGWIELHNPSAAAVSIADYSLTDEIGSARKFVFPALTSIPAGGRHIVFCNPAAAVSATNTGFALNGTGDQVYLFKSYALGGGLQDSVTFGQQVPDYSLARVPDATGPFVLGLPTRGSSNVAATTAPATSVKLNEWLTNPAVAQPTGFELYNTAAQPVLLGGNYLTDQLNNRTKFLIPPLTFLGGSGGSRWLQLTADNDHSATPNHVNFTLEPGEGLGIFSGAGVALDSVGMAPQTVGFSQGRYADGSSAILTLLPTPGGANTVPATDTDGDGIPDAWETANGLNPNNPADAALDLDGDGQSNLQEYLAGTNPQQPGSRLAASITKTAIPGQYAITFTAVAGKTYSVRYKESLTSALWIKLQDVAAQPGDTPMTILDTPAGAVRRFYQVVTPQQP